MIARTEKAPKQVSRVWRPAIPDRVIGIYFALFPAVIAAFLFVQAARAHSIETSATPAAQQTMMAVAP